MDKFLLIFVSIFVPPVAVYIEKGAGKDLLINIFLCFLFLVPAIVHSLFLVTR